jgi:hypothetical protein
LPLSKFTLAFIVREGTNLLATIDLLAAHLVVAFTDFHHLDVNFSCDPGNTRKLGN